MTWLEMFEQKFYSLLVCFNRFNLDIHNSEYIIFDMSIYSLATAQAMQGPTERHLRRRQQYFTWMLKDILYHAYQRAVQIGAYRAVSSEDYESLFRISAPDISRWDNESLARSAGSISRAFADLTPQLRGLPESYLRLLLATAFKFMGDPLPEDQISTLVRDLGAGTAPPPASQGE